MASDDFHEYKLAKERFVADLKGTTIFENSIAVCLYPVTVLFHRVLVLSLFSLGYKNKSIPFNFLLEYITIVVPAVLCQTYDEWTLYIYAILLIATAGLLLLVWVVQGSALWMENSCGKYNYKDLEEWNLISTRKPFSVLLRAGLIIQTCVAILGVDFQVFPRKFGKTETWGTGLMDIGVGAFVISNAMVSPHVVCHLRNGKDKPTVPLLHILRSASPVLIIGSVRMAALKGIEYQEHASEYGTHWNFFFTLAVVHVVVGCINVPIRHCGLFGIILALGHQALLLSGATDYILHAPRVDFFSGNREGIIGCIGYLAIFYLGSALGVYVLRTRRNKKEWWRVFFCLVLLDVFLYLGIIWASASVGEVSRRLVNLTYILWILFVSVQMLSLLLLVDLLIPCSVAVHIVRGVDFNQLPVFMIANLLTGVVNLSIQTIYVSHEAGLGCLMGYMFVVCAIAVALHTLQLKLKVW